MTEKGGDSNDIRSTYDEIDEEDEVFSSNYTEINMEILSVQNFSFVEMRSVEEASNAMALDGIIFDGALVKVRRPSDYNLSLVATLGPSQPNLNLNLVRELLESFVALRGFDLMKDRETCNSKGYAFYVYQDLSVTDIACAALNGIKMRDRTLTVRRANQGQTQSKQRVYCYIHNYKLRSRLMLQPAPIGPPPTKVLSLMQVVTEEELVNDEEYEDIMEEMKMECGKFGKIQAAALQTLTSVIRDFNAKSKIFITLFIGELLNDIFKIIKQQPVKREAITVVGDCLKILMLLHTSSNVAESWISLMILLLEALSWLYQLQRMVLIRNNPCFCNTRSDFNPPLVTEMPSQIEETKRQILPLLAAVSDDSNDDNDEDEEEDDWDTYQSFPASTREPKSTKNVSSDKNVLQENTTSLTKSSSTITTTSEDKNEEGEKYSAFTEGDEDEEEEEEANNENILDQLSEVLTEIEKGEREQDDSQPGNEEKALTHSSPDDDFSGQHSTSQNVDEEKKSTHSNGASEKDKNEQEQVEEFLGRPSYHSMFCIKCSLGPG
nr:splicing factor U2af large subunit B-like isoform X4 [Tanacetum cinerariifolium]